jgi:hypothetical protein
MTSGRSSTPGSIQAISSVFQSKIFSGDRETQMNDELIVRTDVTAGGASDNQHSEELVVRTDVTAGGSDNQHAEGFIVR